MTLHIQNLSFERNYQLLLNNINYTIKRGNALQIIGANGSGKSTLLRLLAGFIEPHEGKILWDNQCIFRQHENYQQQLHYIGHLNGIKPQLTVNENLQLFCALIKGKPDNIKNIIQRLELNHVSNKQTMHLSAGQLRRTALARLLLQRLPLWILDEATTALDKTGQALFKELLLEHLNQGGVAVLTSHHDIELQNIQKIELGGNQ